MNIMGKLRTHTTRHGSQADRRVDQAPQLRRGWSQRLWEVIRWARSAFLPLFATSSDFAQRRVDGQAGVLALSLIRSTQTGRWLGPLKVARCWMRSSLAGHQSVLNPLAGI